MYLEHLLTTSASIVYLFPIFSCEVIEDKLTNRSLQYAFIEFSDAAACERAYFKMEGVLIDDRRIHVDFSQSVAKQRADYFRGANFIILYAVRYPNMTVIVHICFALSIYSAINSIN